MVQAVVVKRQPKALWITDDHTVQRISGWQYSQIADSTIQLRQMEKNLSFSRLMTAFYFTFIH
jgi:hypothetical protein